jgi:lipopolysaccharide export system protein LptC
MSTAAVVFRRATLAVERSSIYLPVVLMALLAMGSYWLVKATPDAPAQAAQRAPIHEPDTYMRQFSVRTYGPGGALKNEVFGLEARHYPDDGTMEIDQARIRSFNAEGALTTATAKLVRANAERTEYLMDGNALVVRDEVTLATGRTLERLEFRGEQVRLFSEADRVVSDRPVVMTRGRDTIHANALDYNNKDRVALLTGRVRAQLMPGPRRR